MCDLLDEVRNILVYCLSTAHLGSINRRVGRILYQHLLVYVADDWLLTLELRERFS